VRDLERFDVARQRLLLLARQEWYVGQSIAVA
jgi:hypothetical protein